MSEPMRPGEQFELEYPQPGPPPGWRTMLTLERLDDWELELTIDDGLEVITMKLTQEQEHQLRRVLRS